MAYACSYTSAELQRNFELRQRTDMAPTVENDPHVTIHGYQYFCAWGRTQRIFCVDVEIKKGVQESDLFAHWEPIPGCGGRCSISFFNVNVQEITGEANSELQDFWVRLQNTSAPTCRLQMAIATSRDEYLRTWDKLEFNVTEPYYHTFKTVGTGFLQV